MSGEETFPSQQLTGREDGLRAMLAKIKEIERLQDVPKGWKATLTFRTWPKGEDVVRSIVAAERSSPYAGVWSPASYAHN